jgi:hypothetical protein
MKAELVRKIGEATGLLSNLARIIEQYEGRDDMQRILIQSTCRMYQSTLFDIPNLPNWRLVIDKLSCEQFPFCKDTMLNCSECVVIPCVIAYDIPNPDRFGASWVGHTLSFAPMSVDKLLMWMINGGIAWTIPNMNKAVADGIDALMSYAHSEICKCIVVRAERR